MLAVIFSAVSYLIFFGTFLYSIGFVGNVGVPRSIDAGPAAALATALVVDAALLGLFAVQHSVMARPAFKRAWTRVVPAAVERSTYVLASSLALALLYWQWRPLPSTIWSTTGAARLVLTGVFWLGWMIVLLSTFMISHVELFGLRQAWLARRAQTPPATAATPLAQRWLYKLVRHPIMLGFLIAFWATPRMTLGHLIFALATTGYILVGTKLEERDLEATHGDAYRDYQRRVRMLLPLPRRQS